MERRTNLLFGKLRVLGEIDDDIRPPSCESDGGRQVVNLLPERQVGDSIGQLVKTLGKFRRAGIEDAMALRHHHPADHAGRTQKLGARAPFG